MEAVSNFFQRLSKSPGSTAATNSATISPSSDNSNSNSNQPSEHNNNSSQKKKPRGILKNASDASKYRSTESYPISDNLDESLDNAQKNSRLNLIQNAAFLKKNVLISSNSGSMATSEQPSEEIEKDFRWDEQNLEQNESEKVPRMKIDEPKTPFHTLPEELQNNESFPNLDEEEVLDINPMDMSLDDTAFANESTDNNSAEIIGNPNTDQKRQSLLLADDNYRQKMVSDALQRRTNTGNTQNPTTSEWDAVENHSNNDNDADTNSNTKTKQLSEKELRKQRFKAKRAAHYNEYHVIQADHASKPNV
jgi:hypothetical protein